MTGSPPIQSPAATPLASSSVAQVSTRSARSLSRAASTVFWWVSGTLRIQPSGSCRWLPRSWANRSLNVSMISDEGIDSGIGRLLIPFVHQGERAADVRRDHWRGRMQVRLVDGADPAHPQQGQTDPDLFFEQLERAHEPGLAGRG